jgi:two-component system, OmpR family, response regulator MtrA
MAGGRDMTTVLVVDDDPDVCDLVAYKLRKSGYEVRCATDGDEAVSAVAERLPDLVLLDVMLPGPSGLEVLQRWRAEPETAVLPVILLTARTQEGDMETGLALGADDYIVKPFSPRELARRVASVIARSLVV